MTDQEKARADTYLDRIEVAVGELQPRQDRNAVLITEIIQAVNALRSLLNVPGAH